MNLVSVKCPSCGATLNIDNGIDTCFCTYCGSKIFLNDLQPENINARVRMKELQHEEIMADKEQHHEILVHELKQKKHKRVLLGLGIAIIACLALIIIVGLFSENSDKKLDEQLSNIVAEIQIDLSNGDYDNALIKANSLYFTGSSNDYEKKWDNMREALIKAITDKLK